MSHLAINDSIVEEDMMLVLRHTELHTNFSYNNIFSLLYKFLVMQVSAETAFTQSNSPHLFVFILIQ
jgi:hypothetical protein